MASSTSARTSIPFEMTTTLSRTAPTVVTISGRSTRTVGSPPESFRERTPRSRRTADIAPRSLTDNSLRLVLGAWQKEQNALHLRVTRTHTELGKPHHCVSWPATISSVSTNMVRIFDICSANCCA